MLIPAYKNIHVKYKADNYPVVTSLNKYNSIYKITYSCKSLNDTTCNKINNEYLQYLISNYQISILDNPAIIKNEK